MQQIRLKKRTAAERTAYLEGYYAGLNDGMRRERPCVVIASRHLLSPDDFNAIRNRMIKQAKDGLLIVPAGFEYMGTVGANPEIQILQDTDREDGYWEDDE